MAERKRANRGDAPQLEDLFQGHSWLSAWNSPEAFGRYVKGMDRSKAWHPGGWDSHDVGWSGTKDMEEALHLAAGNWTQGRELIDKVTSAVKLMYPVRKEPVKYGIIGSVPSVPRAVAGDPLNMIKPVQDRSKRRQTITLISDMSANWTVNSKNFVARAAVLAALIDNIETMGYSCEVIACAHSKSYRAGNITVCTCIVVKESHQPLDLARVAFGLGHPAMFRRMIFADWGGNKENEHLGHGLGSISKMELSDQQSEKHIYHIPNLDGRARHYFQNEETAIKHGIHLFVEALAIQKCPCFRRPDKYKYWEERKEKDDKGRVLMDIRKFEEATGEKKEHDPYDWD